MILKLERASEFTLSHAAVRIQSLKIVEHIQAPPTRSLALVHTFVS